MKCNHLIKKTKNSLPVFIDSIQYIQYTGSIRTS